MTTKKQIIIYQTNYNTLKIINCERLYNIFICIGKSNEIFARKSTLSRFLNHLKLCKVRRFDRVCKRFVKMKNNQMKVIEDMDIFDDFIERSNWFLFERINERRIQNLAVR